jgi:AAA15 family ATPase/GTPase
MYTNINIENFRGIANLKIDDLREINLFVGKNNCGKTSVIESLFLLTGPVNAELPLRINAFRGYNFIEENTWRLLFHNLNIGKYIRITGKQSKPDEKRVLVIKPKEKYSSRNQQAHSPLYDYITESGDIFTKSKVFLDGLVLIYNLYKKNSNEPIKFTTEVYQEGSNIKITPPPNEYLESLKGIFLNPQTITEHTITRFSEIKVLKQTDRIIKILQRMEPSLTELTLGSNRVLYCDIGLDRLIPINMLGDGLFRLLSVIVGISNAQNGVILIDEIDNGFHYTSQEILWDAVFETAKEFNVQVFATTHSMECVKSFSSSYSKSKKGKKDKIRLYRIECTDDKFHAIKYGSKDLLSSIGHDLEVR